MDAAHSCTKWLFIGELLYFMQIFGYWMFFYLFLMIYFCLGAGAVEFIISHAEVQIVFVDEKKIVEVMSSI